MQNDISSTIIAFLLEYVACFPFLTDQTGFGRVGQPFISNHFKLVSLVFRYVHALYLGAQSRWHRNGPRRHFHWRLMFESADITMLRLLEAFLKSAPQLVLQLSIMIHGNGVLPLQGQRDATSMFHRKIFYLEERFSKYLV